ncbi:MAG: hypothetical protein HY927_15130 [Elusimicrobia bacterium]|nr:hypothetical protein [Elusimicrobiota bacterium]
MPVERFRSFDEAREALWGRGDDSSSLRRAAALWAFSERLCPRRVPSGVHRYRSMGEAQAARLSWEGEASR